MTANVTRAKAKLDKQKEKEAKKQAASIAAVLKKAEKKKLALKAKDYPVQKLVTGIQTAKIVDSEKNRENSPAPTIQKAAPLRVVNQLVAKSKKKTAKKAAPLATKAVSNANAKAPLAEKVNTLIPKKKNDKKRRKDEKLEKLPETKNMS